MSKMLRKLAALLTVLMVMASVLPVGTGIAEAATFAMTEVEAVQLLQTYDIVRGNPGGQLDLDQPITRAQAATVFVRTLGYEEMAQLLREAVPFTDAKGHWAAGEITMVERLGLMRGDGNGTFRPQANITYAEVLTVLLRIVKAEPDGTWNPNTIFTAADRLGFAPRGVLPTSVAVRGKIFWALTNAITNVTLPTGETIMQKHLDQTPPTLTLDRASVDTEDSSVVISGTARDAVAVFVGNQRANLDTATGKFSYSASLNVGSNTFTLEARDVAGNKANAQFTAQRKAPIASIEIEGPTALQANTSTKLTVTVKDSLGNFISPTGITASLSGDVATFDIATTTLRTGNTAGRGVLTLTAGNVRRSFTFDVTSMSAQATKLSIAPVNSGVAPSVGKEFTVKVQVLDSNGRLQTNDFWRSVRLTAEGGTDVTISPATANTQAGIASFTVKGLEEGSATLVATSNNLTEDLAVVQFLTTTRVVITASPNPLKPDGTASARIDAALQDENGRPVTNTSNADIRVTLTATGLDTYLSDPYVTIRRGYSNSSSDEGYLKSGLLAGTTTITGRITSGQTYTVQSLPIQLTGTPAPVKLQMITPPSNRFTPNAAPTTVTLQVLDDRNRVVTWGSFAFRLRVTTSNNEPLVNGLPEGVTLTFPDLNYGPYAGTNGVVPGRTHQGLATFKLAYNKSGTVTVTPELISSTDEAYHPTIGLGMASSTTGLASEGAQFLFAGTPASIQLTADSALGRDKPAGAVSSGTSMTVKARVVDANGAPIPGYTGNVTLTRGSTGTKVTRIVSANSDSLTRPTTNGYTEFSLQANNTAGYDTYTATTGNLPPASITVAVRKEKPVTPAIVAIRGVKEGGTSPVIGYVAPDDNYMDVQLSIQDPPNLGEPTYWVLARVTRKGESSAIISDVMVNLASSLPIIRIPKGNLRAGRDIYQVTIHDGFSSNSDPSPDLGLSEAVNSVYNTNYRLTAAYYDAATTKLTLATNNLANNGIVAKELLTIVKDNNQLNLGDERVSVVSVNSSIIALQLNDLAAAFDPDTFNGNVTVQAEDGWYKSNDGVQIAKEATAVVLRPAAVISSGMLDKATKTLYLNGLGLTHGTISLDQIKIGTVALTSQDRLTSTTETRLTVALSQATFDAINALTGPDIVITASAGWLKTSYGGTVHQAPELTGTHRLLQMAVAVNSASYDLATNTLTITGYGFTGATLDPTKLVFRRTTSRTTYQLTSPAVATVVDDSSITVVLGEADAAFFETTNDGGFSGQQVFLNTNEGWLKDAQERQAAPITADRVLFTVPAR